jgi:uncharacterized protein (TIGR02145 family)
LAAPKIDGIGTFSVSYDKQVTFSKGNLQYTQSTNTWSFASAQWEMIGSDVDGVQLYGHYWSATEGNGNNADYLYFYSDAAYMTYSLRDYGGHSVRLVKDL